MNFRFFAACVLADSVGLALSSICSFSIFSSGSFQIIKLSILEYDPCYFEYSCFPVDE